MPSPAPRAPIDRARAPRPHRLAPFTIVAALLAWHCRKSSIRLHLSRENCTDKPPSHAQHTRSCHCDLLQFVQQFSVPSKCKNRRSSYLCAPLKTPRFAPRAAARGDSSRVPFAASLRQPGRRGFREEAKVASAGAAATAAAMAWRDAYDVKLARESARGLFGDSRLLG
jgi:hypothetical protein